MPGSIFHDTIDDENCVPLIEDGHNEISVKNQGYIRRRMGPWTCIMPGALIITIVLLSIILSTSVTAKKRTSSTFPDLGAHSPTCGTSISSALAANCIFDQILYAWIPAACHDVSEYEATLASGPWPYFEHENGTVPVDQHLLSATPIVYSSWDFHVVHCSYAWRLLHKAAVEGRQVPSDISPWEHTMHCSKALEHTDFPGRLLNTKVRMQFDGCIDPF